jgi:SHS family lactate transporter-like MFS transporter
MMSIIFVLLIIWTACGPEQRGSHFELAKAAGDVGDVEEKTRKLEDATRNEQVAEGRAEHP